MSTAALIIAAGRGARAGGTIAKQWQRIGARRIIDITLDIFAAHPRIDHLALVLAAGELDRAPDFPGLMRTAGGADRAASVQAGLALLAPVRPRHVLIHDAARPCLPPQIIDSVLDGLEAGAAGVMPALPVTDALWSGADGRARDPVARGGLFRAQTPQGFDFELIYSAHKSHNGGASDDAEAARAAGLEVIIVPGDPDNIKITQPGDFARATRILGEV